MALRYENLDEPTRRMMVEEIDMDAATTGFYISNYLNQAGAAAWPAALRAAAVDGTDNTLRGALGGAFKQQVERRKPKGGFTMATVPHTAAETLSESQFNMYYMRGLARIALANGNRLIVYRAKAVENPRRESEAMIGTALDPQTILDVLRRTKGVEPEINIPMPNTGITVHLG